MIMLMMGCSSKIIHEKSDRSTYEINKTSISLVVVGLIGGGIFSLVYNCEVEELETTCNRGCGVQWMVRRRFMMVIRPSQFAIKSDRFAAGFAFIFFHAVVVIRLETFCTFFLLFQSAYMEKNVM